MASKIQGVPKNMNVDGEEKRKRRSKLWEKTFSAIFLLHLCSLPLQLTCLPKKKVHHDDGDDDDNVEEKEEKKDGLVFCVFWKRPLASLAIGELPLQQSQLWNNNLNHGNAFFWRIVCSITIHVTYTHEVSMHYVLFLFSTVVLANCLIDKIKGWKVHRLSR